MHTKQHNHKNRLSFDAQLRRSYWQVFCWLLFFIVQMCLAALLSLSWWQWLILLALMLGLAVGLYYQQSVMRIVSAQTDGVWQLQMTQSTTQIHQAYLNEIRLVHLGFVRVAILKFFIISPKKRDLHLVIFEDAIDAHSFSQLVVLSRFGGYRGQAN